MYSGLLLVAIAFSSYASAQGDIYECDDPCTELSDQEDTCVQNYYDESQYDDYYECICSIRDYYIACYSCELDEDYWDQTDYDDWQYSFDQAYCSSLDDSTVTPSATTEETNAPTSAGAEASSTPESSARSSSVRSSISTTSDDQTPTASATPRATTSGGVGSSSLCWWPVLATFLLLSILFRFHI